MTSSSLLKLVKIYQIYILIVFRIDSKSQNLMSNILLLYFLPYKYQTKWESQEALLLSLLWKIFHKICYQIVLDKLILADFPLFVNSLFLSHKEILIISNISKQVVVRFNGYSFAFWDD